MATESAAGNPLAGPPGGYDAPPNTRKAYVTGWNDLTRWCLENRCSSLPSTRDDISRYLVDLAETEGRTLATTRLRLAAIAAARRLGGFPDPTSRRCSRPR